MTAFMFPTDFTVLPVDSWAGERQVKDCPSCGRRGVLLRYSNGVRLYTHYGYLTNLMASFQDVQPVGTSARCLVNPALAAA